MTLMDILAPECPGRARLAAYWSNAGPRNFHLPKKDYTEGFKQQTGHISRHHSFGETCYCAARFLNERVTGIYT